MSAKKLMHNEKTYFESLSQSTQEIVKNALLKAASDRNGPEGYLSDNEALEAIECHSRDGFIAASHNCGGLIYRNFTDLMDYHASGHIPTHEKAANEIKRLIDYSFECVQNDMAEKIGDTDMQYYFGGNKSKLNYYDLSDLVETLEKQGQHESAKKVEKWCSDIQDIESESLSGSENSIMHEFRFMYHGKENGVHAASVSAALNTEGPYHRSSISWAPNAFCEGASEVEIKWRNNAELKRKLDRAFKKVSKVVF